MLRRKLGQLHNTMSVGIVCFMLFVVPHPTKFVTPGSSSLQTAAQIAFQSREGEKISIFVIDTDGTNQRQLTNGQANDMQPTWSPDARSIAFISDRDHEGDVGEATNEVYIMDANGENQWRLTQNEANDLYPDWSPDGEFIAFSSDRDGDFDIYIMKSDGSDQRQLTNIQGAEFEPSWSPDGMFIAFSAQQQEEQEVYVVSTSGTEQQHLAHLEGMDCGSPAWSPSGASLLFSCREQYAPYSSIYVMGFTRPHIQRLSDSVALDADPAWSPNGQQIAFASAREGAWEIFIMDVENQNVRRLTYNGGDKPAWKPQPED